MYNRYLNTTYGGQPGMPGGLHTDKPNAPPPGFAPPPHRPGFPPGPGASSPGPGIPPPGPNPPPLPGPRKPEGTLFAGLNDMLSGRLKNLHFDFDTLIILIAVYFLLADCEDFDMDLLILLGLFYLFGI